MACGGPFQLLLVLPGPPGSACRVGLRAMSCASCSSRCHGLVSWWRRLSLSPGLAEVGGRLGLGALALLRWCGSSRTWPGQPVRPGVATWEGDLGVPPRRGLV